MPKLAHIDAFNSGDVTPTKKPKSKRGLASELEQENVPSPLHQQQQQIQPPYPHHVSPRRLAGFPAHPLEPQRLLLQSASSPLRPRSPPSSSSPRQPSLGFPVIRSPLRSSPLRRCLLPSSSPMRPSGSDSPVRRSLLEERLVMSSPVARRVALDGQENVQSGSGRETPPPCKKSPLSSPIRRRVPLSPRFPKKRWLKKCYYRQHKESCNKESDALAEPIRWNEDSLAPAPKSLIVAAAALVELKGERSRHQWQWHQQQQQQHSDTANVGHDSNQPLNLSLSATTAKSD